MSTINRKVDSKKPIFWPKKCNKLTFSVIKGSLLHIALLNILKYHVLSYEGKQSQSRHKKRFFFDSKIEKNDIFDD